MKKAITFIHAILAFGFLSFAGYGQTGAVVNYYGIPDNIPFEGTDYILSWSSHPNEVYYKHECLPKGEKPNHFVNMLMIDFIQGNFTAKDVAGNKIKTLIERKKTDAVCNYDLIESPDGKEFILDFIMSTSTNNKTNLVEWSCYHYKNYADKEGHIGVILYGISNRGYDDDVTSFLRTLPQRRETARNAIIKNPIPEIQIK
jgi:hypothetical protein